MNDDELPAVRDTATHSSEVTGAPEGAPRRGSDDPPAWVEELTQSLMRKGRLQSVLDVLFPLLGVVLGGCIAVAGSFAIAAYQAEQSAREVLRQDRVEKYQVYSDAANAYAVGAQQRFESCVTGTDDALTDEQPCAPLQANFQNMRYNYVTAWQDLELVGSPRARGLADLMSTLLPSTSIDFTGDPFDTTEDLNDNEALGQLLWLFIRVQRCDTAAVELPDCADEMVGVDDLLEQLQ